MNRDRLLQRFLRYVRIDTTADDASEKYPSSAGQLELGLVVAAELQDMGAADVEQDAHGLVWATIPATVDREVPTIAFNAHFDTSPETTGKDVNPQVIEEYRGGDLPLPNAPGKVIRVAENPELENLHGCTLITTDGTTLLGGDDKAGIAVIMEMAAYLLEHPDIPHGPIRILFTCDEEIGCGVDHVDIDKLAATVCYTLDGAGANELDVETFSALFAKVHITGINIHPSIAKNRMVNAVRVAAEFVDQLPSDHLSPETTDGRDGFVHPIQIEGGVAETTVKLILREFDDNKLEQLADLVRSTARQVVERHPGAEVDVKIRPQYRNMAAGLAKEPRAVAFAQRAHERLGRQARLSIIRGGTDGSQLTEKGVPTPNLSTGQHNPHSPLEWVCLDEMFQATEVLVELVQVWSDTNQTEKKDCE